MPKTACYFDYNATTPLKSSARAAMLQAMDAVGNPSSVHQFGREAHKIMETSREAVAAAISVRPAQVVFTSGGTEANHLALLGSTRPLLISRIEHDCVRHARTNDSSVQCIPVDQNGLVDQAALQQLLQHTPNALVSVMLANNETGVLQDIPAISALVHEYGGLMHCDAAQALGRVPVNFVLLGADLLTLSAHKAGGPKGVGALVLGDKIGITPQLRGGGQEQRRRAGTENLIGIAGFGGAVQNIHDDIAKAQAAAAWRDAFEAEITATASAPQAVIYSKNVPRLPNTSYVGMAGVSAETQLMALDLAGFAVSTGAACSSGKVKPSHVLQAMGCDDKAAGEAIRISGGWATNADDWQNLAKAWLAFYCKKREH